MKARFVHYGNCHGNGLLHFLKRSILDEKYEFVHYANYAIILKEQSAVDLFRDAAKADVFLFQPTPAIQYCELSTEQIIEEIVPKDAVKIAVGDAFNHGFYPIVHHGQWQTGDEVKRLAKENPAELLARYDAGTLHFDCLQRFLTCLLEQTRRETVRKCDIRMAYFIAKNFRHIQLFIAENHPASAYFAEMARQVIELITGQPAEPIPFATNNDANLPCGLLVHPAVVKELELEYAAEERALPFFREYLQRMITDETK